MDWDSLHSVKAKSRKHSLKNKAATIGDYCIALK